MEGLILLGLIMLNGLFAMSEIALVSARKALLVKKATEGNPAAHIALRLGEDPTGFLSTIQIGITSIGILSGIVGEAVFAKPLAEWLQLLTLSEDTAQIVATASVVLGITYVSIVLGELVPKRLGQLSPEAIACMVARPIQLLAILGRPFVVLLSASTQALLRLMGIKQGQQPCITEEEIQALLDEGSQSGVIEHQQHEMVRNVFRLDDRQLGSLMTPRADIKFINTRRSAEENLNLLIDSTHSRFPVCEGNLNQIQGFIHIKQALACLAQGKPLDYNQHLQTCVYVPENLTALEVLKEFRNHNTQILFVVDEYGELEGLITIQDILEAVTGTLAACHNDDTSPVQRADGSWLLDGGMPILELQDCLKLSRLPPAGTTRYHTLNGMLVLLLGQIPSTGHEVLWHNWRFEIVDMDGQRIDKVLATPIHP